MRIAFFYLSAIAMGVALPVAADARGWSTMTTVLVALACCAPVGLAAIAVLEGAGKRAASTRSAWTSRSLSGPMLWMMRYAPPFSRARPSGERAWGSDVRDRQRDLGFRVKALRLPLDPRATSRNPAAAVRFKSADAMVVVTFSEGLGISQELEQSFYVGVPTLCLEPSHDAASTAWRAVRDQAGADVTVYEYTVKAGGRIILRRYSKSSPGEIVEERSYHDVNGVGDVVGDWITSRRDVIDAEFEPDSIPARVVVGSTTKRATSATLIPADLKALQAAALANMWGAATCVELLIGAQRHLARRRLRLNTTRAWTALAKRLLA